MQLHSRPLDDVMQAFLPQKCVFNGNNNGLIHLDALFWHSGDAYDRRSVQKVPVCVCVIYVILDLVDHLGSNIDSNIMRPAVIGLAALFGAEFIYRLYSEKSALSMNLLFLYSTVLAFLIFVTNGQWIDSPLVREIDHVIYHLFVWLVFYAVVTGESSLYGSLRARIGKTISSLYVSLRARIGKTT